MSGEGGDGAGNGAHWGGLAFLLCSRVCVAMYRVLPLFGRLRSSIGVIEREGKLLMIERSDRLGLGFPGGVTMFREEDEHSLRREIREETGLETGATRLLFRYASDLKIPCDIRVYAVAAAGEPRGSWEGTPRWVAPGELDAEIFPPHAEALRLWRGLSAAERGALAANS